MNIAIDVETTKLPNIHPWQLGASLSCISVCDEQGKRATWLVDHKDAWQTPREVAEDINEYLKPYKRLIAHNASFDWQWLKTLGLTLDNKLVYCTMIAEYLIQGQKKQQGLTLNALCEKYGIPLKKDKVKIYWDAGIDTPDIDEDILSVYCEQDAANAMMLFHKQVPRLKGLNLTKLFSLEMESLKVFAEMGNYGMQLSERRLKRYQTYFTKKLEAIDEELTRLLRVPNVGSSAQLSCGLFGGTLKEKRRVVMKDEYDRAITYKTGARAGEVKYKNVEMDVHYAGIGFSTEGIPETEKPGIYQTSVDVLKTLKGNTREQKRVLELLFERSRTSQLKSTYFDGLLNKMINGKVHPSINQALTRTGRTSCSAPNLQNQPRGNTGPVKKCFVSRFNP